MSRVVVALRFALLIAITMLFGGCSNPGKGEPVAIDKHGFPVSAVGPVGEMTRKDGICSMLVEATAYTARPQETKKTAIGVAAWGDKLVPGMKAIAVSRDLIPLGLGHNVEVTIKGLPGTYRVLDKMNKRWTNKIDIYFGDNLALARKWGKRTVRISWGVL